MIINVTGMKGSGKTTALNYFRELGFTVVEAHDTYHSLLHEGKLEECDIVPKNVWDESYVKTVYKYSLQTTERRLVFLGGLLRTTELDFLRTKDKVITVSINVEDDKTRYNRMRKRGRHKETDYSDDDFKLRDLNRNGKSTERYKDNNLEKIIQMADIVVENNGTVSIFEETLFDLGCKIGGMIQSGRYWYEEALRYGHENYALLSQLEALLGGRKNILNSLGRFRTAIALGCNEGREMDLISANDIVGVDNDENAISRGNKGNIYLHKDILQVAGKYDFVSLLRVIGGSKIETEPALAKVMDLAQQVAVVSIATAGITPEGRIKYYQTALNGAIQMPQYIERCRRTLEKSFDITEIDTVFEHYFICRK